MTFEGGDTAGDPAQRANEEVRTEGNNGGRAATTEINGSAPSRKGKRKKFPRGDRKNENGRKKQRVKA